MFNNFELENYSYNNLSTPILKYEKIEKDCFKSTFRFNF